MKKPRWLEKENLYKIMFESEHKTVLEILEYLLTFFFTVEYIARVYCSPRPRDYVLSFFGIIDLLSTLPPYLSYFLPNARYMILLVAEESHQDFRLLLVCADTRYLLGYADVYGRKWRT